MADHTAAALVFAVIAAGWVGIVVHAVKRVRELKRDLLALEIRHAAEREEVERLRRMWRARRG